MSYRVGYCTQCGTQVMVQDTNGRWNCRKVNFREVDMFFNDGKRARTILCDKCVEVPDFERIMSELTCDDSQAGTGALLKNRGIPTNLALTQNPQGIRLGK